MIHKNKHAEHFYFLGRLQIDIIIPRLETTINALHNPTKDEILRE